MYKRVEIIKLKKKQKMHTNYLNVKKSNFFHAHILKEVDKIFINHLLKYRYFFSFISNKKKTKNLFNFSAT